MTIFLAILLTALTFGFVIYPFFRPRPQIADSGENEKLQELHSRRDTTYSMLKELEFDYHSGILTEADYHDLEAKYKRKAIAILKDIDASKKGTDVDEEIEKLVLELRQSKRQFCTQCGTQYQESDRFCSHCGARLKPGGK